MAVTDAFNSFVEILPVEFVPQYTTFRQCTRVRKDLPTQIFVFGDAIIDRHTEPRKHDAYETVPTSVTLHSCKINDRTINIPAGTGASNIIEVMTG
jgi:hypothetical protein